MGRTITAAFKTSKNASTNKPIYLFTIYDYDGAGTNLYLAQYDADIVYSGITYTRFPIKFDAIGENSQGEIDSLKITLANVSRLIQNYLEAYDWRGLKVDIILVWADRLDDTAAKLTDTFYIDNYSADEKNVEVVLSSKFDILSVTLPAGKYLRNNCRWKFKGTECGYAGAQTSCNRTFARCQALNNQLRYGGFPSIPLNRIYVG